MAPEYPGWQRVVPGNWHRPLGAFRARIWLLPSGRYAASAGGRELAERFLSFAAADAAVTQRLGEWCRETLDALPLLAPARPRDPLDRLVHPADRPGRTTVHPHA